MEKLFNVSSDQLFGLLILAGLLYLIYYSWQRKKKTLNALARSLNARLLDSGVIGKYGNFEYIIYFQEGHPGGAASGPTSVGYPSLMRIVVEKQGIDKFRIQSKGAAELPASSTKSPIIEAAARKLFKSGFNEVEYDGTTLDIKLSPVTLDGSINARYFEKILPTVAEIVEVL